MSQKINEVDIRITRADITSVSIGLENGEWQLSISGNLVSETGQEVTSFSYSSNGWNDKTKIEVPIAIPGIGAALFQIVQPLIIEKIQGHFRSLEAGESEVEGE
jgi:hypothetical protein